MFSSPQNHPTALGHRHSFGGGEQIGWPPSHHPSQHGLHHQHVASTPGGGAVKMELAGSAMHHAPQHPHHSLHTSLDGTAPPAAGQQQSFGMHHPQPQHAVFSSSPQHQPHLHSRASAPSLPIYPGIAHQTHPHGSGGGVTNLHQTHAPHPAQVPLHTGMPSQPVPGGTPVDPTDASREGRRATLPLAHADLELELQIRHNMLIEQQHRIAQLEEELNRSRLEIERLNSKVRQYEQEKAKGTQKKAQSRYWTPEEHQRFLEGVEKYGAKDVKSIALHVGTRNATQVRTHAQKYYLRIDREKKRKEERESKEKEERKDGEEGEVGTKDEAKAKTSSPDNRKRYSEPSPALYKAAVLALLTDWVEEDYDTFVNGLQVFDSEPNVQRRLQLIQEKLLPHKTLDELNAINEAIEQQAIANRRKRMKMSNPSDDLFSSDIADLDSFRHDNLDNFSGGGFAAPYGVSNEGGRGGLMSGRMASSMAQSMAYGRRSSLPAFPVTHSISGAPHHRHQPLHSQHSLHHSHRSQQHMPPPQEQDHSHSNYGLSIPHGAPMSGETAPAEEANDDSTFSTFSQIITRHSSGSFAPPRSPVSSVGPSAVPGRRMSAPNINLLAIEADYKQQQNMRQRYSVQFDGSSQSSGMLPPAMVDRRASLHSIDQTDFHPHDLSQVRPHPSKLTLPNRKSKKTKQQGGLGASHDGTHSIRNEQIADSVHQRRHSLDMSYQHSSHDDQSRQNADMTQTLHHDMVASCHPGQPPSDNFDPSAHMPSGNDMASREQDAGPFGEDVWSTRILGMSAGEQMPPPSSDDFSMTTDSTADSSSGSSSSTDAFGLLSPS